MDYYQILNISYSATEEEIKSAFRKLSKERHPDNYPDATGKKLEKLNEMYGLITEAYETLSDSKKKQRYDLLNNISAKRKEEEIHKQTVSKEEIKTTPKEEKKESDYFLANYNMVKRYLDINYDGIIVKNTKIYSKDNKIVALCNDNIITMYFECSSDIIWNHVDKAMVGIVKDFPIFEKDHAKICDCVIFGGICGSYNYIIRILVV